MSIIEQIMGILAPYRCLGCGLEGSLLCTACAAALPRPPAECIGCGDTTPVHGWCAVCRQGSALDAVIAATSYDGLAKELVHYLKFERAGAAAVVMATVLAPYLLGQEFDIVTFVPTAPARIRTRGYDQAARIARALARKVNLPCQALLGRSGGQRQVGQGRAVRHTQMRDAFYLRRTAVRGKRIVLVDDVITTGSSCQAAAGLLRDAGAASVSAAAFAVAVHKKTAA